MTVIMDDTGNSPLQETSSPARLLESIPAGILAFDRNFIITFLNDNIYRFNILNPENEPAPGVSLLSGIFTSSSGIEEELQRLPLGDVIERELSSSETLSGDEISVMLKATPLFEGESFAGGVILIEDLRIKSQEPADSADSDKRSALLLNALADTIITFDGTGKALTLSGKQGECGWLVKKVVPGETFFTDAFHEELQEELRRRFLTLPDNPQREHFLLSGYQEGSPKKTEVTLSSIYAELPGRMLHVVHLHDVTSLLEESDSLRMQIEELRHYESITEAAADAVVTLSRKGDVLFWNKAAGELFGLSRSQIYGKNFNRTLRVFEQEDFSYLISNLTSGDSQQREIRYYLQEREIVIQLTFTLFAPAEGKEEILLLCSDVTSRTKLLSAAEEQIQRLQTAYNALPDMVIRYNSAGRLLSWNHAFEKTSGYTSASGGISLYDFFADTSLVAEMTSETGKKEFSAELHTAAGKPLSAVLRVVDDLPDEKGSPTFSAIIEDISDRLAFEKELSLMQSVFATSEDGIAIESDGRYILANDAFTFMFGYRSLEEMSKADYYSIVSPEEKGLFEQYIHSRAAGTAGTNRLEFLGIKKDGARFHIEASVTHFMFQKQGFTVIIVRDISERKRAQQAIKESEERYRSITENLDDFFWTAERFKGLMKTTFYSAAVEKMTGYTQTELLVDSKLFLKMIYPDDFPEVKEELKKFYQNFYKKSTELVFRILHKQGNIVWVRNKLTAIRDRKGEIIKMYGLVSDISAQKHAEQVLQESAENLSKLNEAKDRFISIISHDLRTPFSSIMGFTDILMNESDLTTDDMRSYVGFIRSSAESMLTLVNSLLDWTKIQTGRISFEPNRYDLADIVSKNISTVQGVALKKDIEILSHIDKDIYVFVDEGLLMQVFNNLLSNALKFTRSGGKIEILAEHSEHPRFLKITVKDNGVGMSEENLQKLFKLDSKLTTEGTAGEKGTGLGLTLVWEIVNRHGGKIWAESKKNEGSSFIFTLPKASASILLVDDSNTDRILYSKIIRNITHDYEVITAVNGKEALKIVETAAPALVIMDHIMPVMNGLDFVRTLQYSTIKGKPPVIILSGDVGKSETLAYNDLGIEYVFSKPVNLARFKDAVEKCLKKLLT